MILKLAHATDPRWLVAPGDTPPEAIIPEDIFEMRRYGRPLTTEPGEPDAVYFADPDGTWRIAGWVARKAKEAVEARGEEADHG